MPTTLTPNTLNRAAAPDLDARLALTSLAMDSRLDEAAVAFEVNTAHLPTEPVDLDSLITTPILPAPDTTPGTPLADCLRRARSILTERGWTRGHLKSEQGSVCLIGALRAAATSRHQADDACAVLLDVIRAAYPQAETVPAWNDSQHGPALPVRLLDQAATHADKLQV